MLVAVAVVACSVGGLIGTRGSAGSDSEVPSLTVPGGVNLVGADRDRDRVAVYTSGDKIRRNIALSTVRVWDSRSGHVTSFAGDFLETTLVVSGNLIGLWGSEETGLSGDLTMSGCSMWMRNASSIWRVRTTPGSGTFMAITLPLFLMMGRSGAPPDMQTRPRRGGAPTEWFVVASSSQEERS